VPVRKVRFDYPDDVRAAWHPARPELAAACNALSLGMPYGEPYVISSVRAVLDDARRDDPELAERINAYVGQERAHFRAHARFNELITDRHPTLTRVERWIATSYRWLARRGSREFNLAFAAGFETVAFSAARWMDRRRVALFTGADPVPATLFLWHLAEEVEHKTVAHDAWASVDSSRLRYAAGMATSFALLIWFIFLGTMVQLAATGRILNPMVWLRLVVTALGFSMEVLPTMATTVLRGHHPSRLADPPWLPVWLSQYDETTATMPLWNAPIQSGLTTSRQAVTVTDEKSPASA